MRRILTALLLLVTATASAQTSDLQKVRVDDFAGGQNSKDFYDKLQPNQGTLVQNLSIDNKGQAITRKGQALYVTDVGSTPFLGLGAFYQDTNTSYVVSASGTTVVRNNGTNWQQISTSSLGANHDTGFIQALNKLFTFNGSASTAWWDGTTWTAGGSWPTSPPTATTAAWLSNYLFLAGDPTNPDWVYVSTNLDPTSFPTVNLIKINTGDGQAIKRLEAYRTGEIVVYKERSIFDLDISGIDSTCSPQPICQWSVTAISRDIGTPAPRSVVSLGNDQWFLSSEPIAVRSLIRSESDRTFVDMRSYPIQDIFDGSGDRILNETHIDKAAAVLFDHKYILAIPTGSSAVNDFVVVYDFIAKSWFTIDGWYPRDWIVFENDLYYTDANDGRVVQCFVGTTGDFGTVASSASGPTVAINSKYATRGIDFGFPENFKALDAVSIEFFPTGDYDATASIDIDNSGWVEVGSINLQGDALTLPFTLPATLTGEGFAIETLQLQRYGEFKKIAVKVEQEGTGEQLILQAADVYGRVKPWRRE